MRGQTGIVCVIDGIRRTSADFSLDWTLTKLESVSILKDLGGCSRLRFGCQIVFSSLPRKQGKAEKMSITFPYRFCRFQPEMRNNRNGWDGPGYAYWYNKARELQKKPLRVFTAGMVQKMRDGVDGWGNTNWYDKGIWYRHPSTPQHFSNRKLAVDEVRFFASIGYLNEDGNT
ncbi:hypothetical protein NXW86_29775 [Bacteroides thetaiotaomicron]|uniref:hypothetical protein n=1 Tax=Bacteroides thetaiotaomicron TaxID=818 RepID=UPI0021660038|nr:hypothetical protein [Bacteroides thetaiotaomicron]MCS2453156.1 hypothetical protein [Bacteroides thetaiotaomicron]